MQAVSNTVIGDKKTKFFRSTQAELTAPHMSAQEFLAHYQQGRFVLEANGNLHACSRRFHEIIPIGEPIDVHHLSHDLRQPIRQVKFSTSTNQAFYTVVEACSRPHFPEKDRWLGPKIKEILKELYQTGHAYTLEIWLGDDLAAGTVGLQIGAMYIGLSAFHNSAYRGSSKVATLTLHGRLHQAGFQLFDSISPSLISQLLGGRLMRATDVWPLRQKAMQSKAVFPIGKVRVDPMLFSSKPAFGQPAPI